MKRRTLLITACVATVAAAVGAYAVASRPSTADKLTEACAKWAPYIERDIASMASPKSFRGLSDSLTNFAYDAELFALAVRVYGPTGETMASDIQRAADEARAQVDRLGDQDIERVADLRLDANAVLDPYVSAKRTATAAGAGTECA